MKEQILSLLEAGCKVRVKLLNKERYGETVISIIRVSSGNKNEIMFRAMDERRLTYTLVEDMFEILEVILPTRPKYKVGDKVMVYSYYRREWKGPDIVERVTWAGLLLPSEEGFVGFRRCAPYHEGIQYNPLPTSGIHA